MMHTMTSKQRHIIAQVCARLRDQEAAGEGAPAGVGVAGQLPRPHYRGHQTTGRGDPAHAQGAVRRGTYYRDSFNVLVRHA